MMKFFTHHVLCVKNFYVQNMLIYAYVKVVHLMKINFLLFKKLVKNSKLINFFELVSEVIFLAIPKFVIIIL